MYLQEKKYMTLLDVAEEVLSNKQNLEFSVLFDSIKDELFQRWRNENDSSISDEEILQKKRGELYRLLTVDGRFFHNIDGTWTTIRPEYNKN